jgi:hypothetical protein
MHSYLHFTSGHPYSVKKVGPYGQFLKLPWMYGKEEDYTKECDLMASYNELRGYPHDIILESRDKATKISHNRAVSGFTNTKDTIKPVVFITTYNQNAPSIRNIMTKHWDILQRLVIAKLTFPEPPLVAKRRNPNLKGQKFNITQCTTTSLNPVPKLIAMYVH